LKGTLNIMTGFNLNKKAAIALNIAKNNKGKGGNN
jgi:hypothetical protein